MKPVLKSHSTRLAVAASASLVAFALLAAPGTAQAEGDRKSPAATNVDRSVPKDPARGGSDTVMSNRGDRSDTASGTMRNRMGRDTAGTQRDTLPPDSNYVPVRPGF